MICKRCLNISFLSFFFLFRTNIFNGVINYYLENKLLVGGAPKIKSHNIEHGRYFTAGIAFPKFWWNILLKDFNLLTDFLSTYKNNVTSDLLLEMF